jgi:outer membrane receptor protein involved in Fe transport
VRSGPSLVAAFGIVAWGYGASAQELTDDDLLRLAEEQSEVIEIWDERPDKPYDRDTEVRLTGEELARRGATDLATALSLIPEINVRDVGRGGFNIDIRGARKGAVRVLVDGVSVSDPYYGTFDVSTIPITDIVQIRVSTGPASPIDGPGGPGGVIEVHTRDAAGARLVVGRLTSDTLPTFGASATGRTALTPELAVRLSTSALWGLREFELPSNAALGESRRATTGGARLEYRPSELRRVAFDGFVDDRGYVPPPNEESDTATILVIDRETTARAQLSADERRGTLQLQGRAWTHAIKRQSRYFRDAGFTDESTGEELFALRVGGNALATRPIIPALRWIASATVDYERARVATTSTPVGSGPVTVVNRGDVTLLEAAAGAQYEQGPVRVDAAAGVALPVGLGAAPWPEAKLVGRYKVRPQRVEVIATVAHKGRTPSLRERYDAQNGNPELDPEIASHGELKVVATPVEQLAVELAPYYRRTDGTVRIVDGVMANLGAVDIRGLDGRVTVRPHATFEAGAAYALTLARSRNDDAGPWMDDPLPRLPEHRGDAWLKAKPLERLTAIARVRYLGESSDNAGPVAAYTLLELSASVTWRDDWMAVVKCDDVTDERPETRAGFHLPGRVFSLIVQGTWD